mmetsp:Transcript_42072/g.71158  ORF Transcript_42072/g.71158 Transcript_42072/m.71158 type:complete len:289 (-) Transcript_42072:767-1633(-)
MATSLLNHLALRGPHNINLVHDVVPQRQFHVADQSQHLLHLIFGDPALDERQVGPKTHASSNGMAVQHARCQFVARRPGVSVGMRAALMCLPQITVLGLHIGIQSPANDQVTQLVELFILGAVSQVHCTKLGSDKLWSSLLHQAEQLVILSGGHLDDLGKTVTKPALVQRCEEVTVRDGEHRSMVGTIQVLVAKPIAASSWGRTGVNTADNRCAQHNIWCRSVIQTTSETSNVGNNTTTNDKHGLITGNTILLELVQHLADLLQGLVNLVTTGNHLLVFDIVVGKVFD